MKISLLISLFVLGTFLSPGLGQSLWSQCVYEKQHSGYSMFDVDDMTYNECRGSCQKDPLCMSYISAVSKNSSNNHCSHGLIKRRYDRNFATGPSNAPGCQDKKFMRKDDECSKMYYVPKRTPAYRVYIRPDAVACAKLCKTYSMFYRPKCSLWNYSYRDNVCSMHDIVYYRPKNPTKWYFSGSGYSC